MRRCIAVVATVVVLFIGMVLTQIDRADEVLVVSIGEQLGGDVDFATSVAPAAVQPGEHVLRTIAAHSVVPQAVMQASPGLLSGFSDTPAMLVAAWNYNGLKTFPLKWNGVVMLPRQATYSRPPALVLLL